MKRLTISALLKAVIAVTAAVVIALVSLNAWHSWQRRLALAKEYGDVKRASETLESQSQHLGGQVNYFLSRIRAA